MTSTPPSQVTRTPAPPHPTSSASKTASKDQGCRGGHGELEPHNARALDRLRAAVDARPKDWASLQKHAVEFHLRNAAAWANEATGQDLAAQVDPDFRHGPTALTAAALT